MKEHSTAYIANGEWLAHFRGIVHVCVHAHTQNTNSLDMTLPVVVRVTSGPFSLRGLSTSVIFVSFLARASVCRAAKLQDDPALPEIWQKGSLERESVLQTGRGELKSLPARLGTEERSLASQ